MNKLEWKNYKQYNLKHIWRTSNECWISELFDFPLIKFLKKIKSGQKIFYNFLKLRYLIKRKPIIPVCQYAVTTRCTLNCKNCNSFIPYFTTQTHAKPISFEQFKKDLDKMLEAVDYINIFGFVGGEPLLVNDLYKMVEYALSKRQIHYVFMCTNCTILPSDELLKVMKNKKFAVQLSDYRQVKNIKNNVTVKYNTIKKLLVDNKIKISYIQEKLDANNWQTMPQLFKDVQDSEKLKKIYSRCFGLYCNIICEGIFSQCVCSMYMHRNLELTESIKDELINLREEISSKDLTGKFIKFYSKQYSEFCHYCHFDNIQYGLPCGEQVE